MEPERWAEMKAIFRAALDQAPDERDAFVAEACGRDAALRAEVERLLALDAGAPSFLAVPAPALVSPEPAAPAVDPLIGHRIGRFRLTRCLATGGMGAVYVAEQDSPQRTVAVKVLRPGLVSRSAARRFEYEAEVLGRLQHPGIARIFEAGTFDLGAGAQPYFAMELIDGLPLTAHAARHGLRTVDRLRLLRRICDAVNHAHQNGVIHRDLKPGNILVDAAGGPHVLDFGIARATDADVQATTMHTSVGELIGTINYMSPEQVSGDPGDLDVRSDVYALGVIGYELLTGALPYELAGRSLPDALRTIATDEPRPLSVVRREFRGDLDTIFAKAVEKDKTRRYQSAAELGDDLGRFLAHQPIRARRPTTLYQMRKFTRRNRALVGGAVATFVVLLLGLVLYAVEARRARFEADRYHYEADKATAVTNYITNDFVMKLLARVGAIAAEGDVPVEELMTEASANVRAMFAGRPLAEAAVRNELGTMYYNLGLFPQAEEEFRTCLDLWEHALGTDHPDTLKAVNNLGQTLGRLGRGAEAEPLYRRAFAGRRRVLGEDDRYTLVSMNNLAMMLLEKGESDEAETLLRRTLEGQRRVHGERHKHTLYTMLNLGRLHYLRGDLEAAEMWQRRSLAGLRATLGDDHVTTLVAMNRLGRTLRERGQLGEAGTLLGGAAEGLARTVGDPHPDTFVALCGLAGVHADRGEHAAAETLYRRALDTRPADQPLDVHTLDQRLALIRSVRAQGRTAEAVTMAGAVLDDAPAILRDDDGRLAAFHVEAGTGLLALGRYAEAEPILLAGHAACRRANGATHTTTRDAAARLAELYEAWARPEAAAEWRSRME